MQPEPDRLRQIGLLDGEALTLWRVRRDATRIRCFVAEWPGAYWLAVECAGGELLASETVPAIDAVLARSAEIKAALHREGWREE